LEALDREYPLDRFGRYLTIFYLIINIREGTITYSNAAHPSPVIVRRDGTLEMLEKGGTIIGLDGIVPFEEEEKRLDAGDRVVLFTDGIAEYFNDKGEFFGEDRFYSLLADRKHRDIEGLLDAVVASINDFGKGRDFQDDITLVVLEYGKTGSGNNRTRRKRAGST
jgi:sigma-B regulation protein RsbU (phosphoserine phosphatase)